MSTAVMTDGVHITAIVIVPILKETSTMRTSSFSVYAVSYRIPSDKHETYDNEHKPQDYKYSVKCFHCSFL